MQKKLLVAKDTEIAKGYMGIIKEGKIEIRSLNDGRILSFDDKKAKIEVFEAQIKEWFLNRANDLIDNEDNDFIVMMICCAYIDSIQQYRKGKSSDAKVHKFFTTSLKRIVPGKEDDIYDAIYTSTRCGLFHNGMVKENIRITREIKTECINYDADGEKIIKINPVILLKEIQNDFDKYLEDLRNEYSEYYKKFEKMFVFAS